jgi:hypothetical protein
MKLGTLAKLATGGLGPDEFLELMSSIGVEMESRPVTEKLPAFESLAESASLPGAEVHELRGVYKDGHQFHVLMVFCKDRSALSRAIQPAEIAPQYARQLPEAVSK